MANISENMKYYSVFCPAYDVNATDTDLLSKIRYDFFNEHRRQKNKIVKELGDKVYRYSYFFEEGKPAKWKKMMGDILLERSRVNPDNSYSILVQDENKNLIKILYFDSEHNWQKTEYFKDKLKTTFLNCKDGRILAQNYDSNTNKIESYELFPVAEDFHEYTAEALSSNLTTLLCKTNHGVINFLTDKQIQNLAKLKTNDLKIEKKIKEQELLKPDVEMVDFADKDTKNIDLDNSHKPFICYKDECICPYNETYGKTIPLDNGSTYYYFGQKKGELRDGFGKTVDENGFTVYEGNYKNDLREGLGVYYESKNIKYVGNFEKNKKNGFGLSINTDFIRVSSWKDGAKSDFCSDFNSNGDLVFAGKFKNNLRSGTGVTYDNGSDRLLVGSYENGEFLGKGTLFDEKGNLFYRGDIVEGNCQGFGIQYNLDGTIKYRGNWKNNQYNGQGCLYFDDGRKIEGSFETGEVEGFACEFDSHGKKIYEGNWKKSLYNEEGTKYLNNGNYLKGLFDQGLAQGVLLEFNADGEVIYKGNFSKDAYNGDGSLYVNGEKIYEGSFENNAYNGFGCLFENGRCTYDGQFSNGMRSGFGTLYRDDEVIYVGNWLSDTFDGIGMLYDQAKLKYVGHFSKGRKHGRINEIYEGKVIKECIFDNDELTYVKEYQYPSMNIIYDGNMHNGKRSGMGCLFTEYGEKEAEGIFSNGEITTRMKVFLKKLLPLSECDNLSGTDYDKFRYGPVFVVEEELLGGLFSGLLKDSRPNGKGTILYSDHRYTGDFLNGVPKGSGVIYKNDGTKISGKFFESEVLGSSPITFESGVTYNFISDS